jgi:hypothetical protein
VFEFEARNPMELVEDVYEAGEGQVGVLEGGQVGEGKQAQISPLSPVWVFIGVYERRASQGNGGKVGEKEWIPALFPLAVESLGLIVNSAPHGQLRQKWKGPTEGVANGRKGRIVNDVEREPLASVEMWGQLINHRLNPSTLSGILTNLILAVEDVGTERKVAGSRQLRAQLRDCGWLVVHKDDEARPKFWNEEHHIKPRLANGRKCIGEH